MFLGRSALSAVTETTAVRYSLAGKRTKGIILDELCATTGWHRNHARKALKTALQPKLVSPRSPRQPMMQAHSSRGVRFGRRSLLTGASSTRQKRSLEKPSSSPQQPTL